MNNEIIEEEERIAEERARKQATFTEDLETVTDPDHNPAIIREPDNIFHHRRKSCYRTASEIITVRETPGKNY